MRRARPSHLSLPLSKRTGRQPRDRAVRLAASGSQARTKAGYLAHVARDPHKAAHPVHVTMRRVERGPSFRTQRVCAAIRAVIAGAKRNGVRVLHYSVQHNHLHLLVEGSSSANLSNQMRTLFSRIAFAVNTVARRHGKLFRERHHRHALTTPREVRNALVYILFNDRKHARGGATATARAAPADLDLCSSALWFTGWDPGVGLPPLTPDEMRILASDMERPTIDAATWLARIGWRRGGGLIRFNERPRFAH